MALQEYYCFLAALCNPGVYLGFLTVFVLFFSPSAGDDAKAAVCKDTVLASPLIAVGARSPQSWTNADAGIWHVAGMYDALSSFLK